MKNRVVWPGPNVYNDVDNVASSVYNVEAKFRHVHFDQKCRRLRYRGFFSKRQKTVNIYQFVEN